MRIQFSALAAAALALLLSTACQREETGFGLPAGEEVTVTISASVPSGGPSVKSNADPGNGDQINRCILGVYMVDGENRPQLYGTLSYEQVTGQQATFEDVTLLTGYDYKLVFWADNVASTTNLLTDNHYVTTGFPKVTYNTADGHPYMSSDDTRDAFYGVFDLNDFSGEVKDSYTLTRPFGQLNIFTTDYNDIKMDVLKPAKVQMAFTSIPTGLNLLTGATTSGLVTGAVSDIQEITFPVVSGAKQLSFDYIFAPKDEELLIEGITMSFYDADGSQLAIDSYTFPGLPVRANYRTNVTGALLTKSSDLKIGITDDFTETIEKDLYTVSGLDEALVILNGIAENTSVTQPEIISITIEDQIPSTEGENSIELPGITTEVELNLTQGIASGATFTIQDVKAGTSSSQTEGSDFTGKLVLNNQSTEQQGALVINQPKGSAEIAEGSYSSIDVTTADNTFILGSDAEVGSLTINKGTVKLYGMVTGIFEKAEGYTGTVYRCLSDQTSMDNLIADKVSGYQSILVEEPASVLDGKGNTFNVPMLISTDADVNNFNIEFEEGTYTTSNAIVINDGAKEVHFSNMRLYSQAPSPSLLMLRSTGTYLGLENCELILTRGGRDQAGINIRNGGKGNVLNVVMEDSYIGFDSYENRINKDINQDYYIANEDYFGASYSRGINVGNDPDDVCDGTCKTNLVVRNSYIEGTYYCINTVFNVAHDIDIENSVFDGRAGLNIWTTSDVVSYINVHSSKFIGRNTFSGPKEEFATIVFNGKNSDDGGRWVKNTVVTVEGSQICSYNNPQTETNRQYSVQMRSQEKNHLILSNGTRLRELYAPRLDHLVDLNYPINEVVYDETVRVEGMEGATIL